VIINQLARIYLQTPEKSAYRTSTQPVLVRCARLWSTQSSAPKEVVYHDACLKYSSVLADISGQL
jgi:hypothetical protein